MLPKEAEIAAMLHEHRGLENPARAVYVMIKTQLMIDSPELIVDQDLHPVAKQLINESINKALDVDCATTKATLKLDRFRKGMLIALTDEALDPSV